MSLINNALINSCSANQLLVSNGHFKVVRSNISGNCNEPLSQAQVVIVGETHNRDDEAILYTDLISKTLKSSSSLLVEQKPVIGVGQLRFFSQILSNVDSWDLRNSDVNKVIQSISQTGIFLLSAKFVLLIEELAINSVDDFKQFLKYFNCLRQLFFHESKEDDLTDFENFADSLQTFSQSVTAENFSIEQADQLKQSTLDFLKVIYLDILEEKSESFYQGIVETFMQRNVSLLNSIKQKIAEGKSQILVIAGKAHVKKSKSDPTFNDAVEMLMTGLEQSKISYLVLRPKTNSAKNTSQKTTHSSTHLSETIKAWKTTSFKMTSDIYLGIQVVREYFSK